MFILWKWKCLFIISLLDKLWVFPIVFVVVTHWGGDSADVSVSDPVLQSEDPFVVRLLFEPSGRPDSQQDYYLTAKENLCVVCGKADSYIRFDSFYLTVIWFFFFFFF